MYLKKLFSMDSLTLFDQLLKAKLQEGAPHQIKTLIERRLKEMILSRILRCARLIKMIDCPTKINQMGNEGENLHSFMEHLILEMDQSGWSTGLYWLKDLDTSKKNQADLGDKVHKA